MTVVTVLEGELLSAQPVITGAAAAAAGGIIPVEVAGRIRSLSLSELDDVLSSPTTEAFTASDTLTTAESGKWCTNIGAVIAVTLTAPASPVLNDEYTLERVAGYAFRFKPGAGHTVNGGTADKYVELAGAGMLTFKYIRAGQWVITNDSAPWNYEP